MMRLAQKQALKSPFKKHRVGAVIVKGHRILATGYNEIRYSKYHRRPTTHAEAAAVVSLLKERRMGDLAGSDIYVTRYTKSGDVSCAKPCIHCTALLRSVGVVRVFYTDFDGSTKEMKL